MTIEQPGMYDVICNCRSHTSFDHIGNRRYRVTIENHSLSYDKARTKGDKSLIITSILATIHNAGGNFIRKTNKHANHWEIVPEYQTKEKIGHALRDAIVSQLNKLSSGENPSGRDIYDIIGGSRGNKLYLKTKSKRKFSLKDRLADKPHNIMIEVLANATRPRKKADTRNLILPPSTSSLETTCSLAIKDTLVKEAYISAVPKDRPVNEEDSYSMSMITMPFLFSESSIYNPSHLFDPYITQKISTS